MTETEGTQEPEGDRTEATGSKVQRANETHAGAKPDADAWFVSAWRYFVQYVWHIWLVHHALRVT